MLVVFDTNVLVLALWSRDGAPARALSLLLSGRLIPCYDYRILEEYREVLKRPKFNFTDNEINALLDWIVIHGCSVIAEPLDIKFVDESDKKFYEVAKFCGAILITGNMKHFPEDESVMTAAKFLEQILRKE